MAKKDECLKLLGFKRHKEEYYTHKSFGEQQFDFSEVKLENLAVYLHALGWAAGKMQLQHNIKNLLNIQ